MMSNQPFKLSYTWEELRPIRPLYLTTLAIQFVGAGISLSIFGFDRFFEAFWLGGAMATLPGFLAGLPVQLFLRPGSLTEQRQMVALLGFISVVLTVAAVFFPPVAVNRA
jgi:hypothetical protein